MMTILPLINSRLIYQYEAKLIYFGIKKLRFFVKKNINMPPKRSQIAIESIRNHGDTRNKNNVPFGDLGLTCLTMRERACIARQGLTGTHYLIIILI